jgi:hypothetical protein
LYFVIHILTEVIFSIKLVMRSIFGATRTKGVEQLSNQTGKQKNTPVECAIRIIVRELPQRAREAILLNEDSVIVIPHLPIEKWDMVCSHFNGAWEISRKDIWRTSGEEVPRLLFHPREGESYLRKLAGLPPKENNPRRRRLVSISSGRQSSSAVA